MRSPSVRWIATLAVPAGLIAVGTLIGILSGDGRGSGALACEDRVSPEQRDNLQQSEWGATPAHEAELNALAPYPGCMRVNSPVSSGAGTFAWFSVKSTPAQVAEFYQEKLPPLGWKLVRAPTVLPAKGGTGPRTAVTLIKDELSLEIYLDDNPCKGANLGTTCITFRLQDIATSTPRAAPTPTPSIEWGTLSYDEKMAACHAMPNGSIYETWGGRFFVMLPKDIYPFENLGFVTMSGDATAGWISNGGLPGQAYGSTATCWSSYYELIGTGQMDIRVKSAVESVPDYLVQFKLADSNPPLPPEFFSR